MISFVPEKQVIAQLSEILIKNLLCLNKIYYFKQETPKFMIVAEKVLSETYLLVVLKNDADLTVL